MIYKPTSAKFPEKGERGVLSMPDLVNNRNIFELACEDSRQLTTGRDLPLRSA
jgi:hypothetical protein